ncbi:MAG: hypothetical protein M3O50_01220 [Myxococcota bacterium]|nr:hypothetical protein [Myxococcota bacterium]
MALRVERSRNARTHRSARRVGRRIRVRRPRAAHVQEVPREGHALGMGRQRATP